MFIFILILLGTPALLVLIDFTYFLFTSKRFFSNIVIKPLEGVVLIVLPLVYLSFFDFKLLNDCCNDSATFSPQHRQSMYALIILCLLAFFYSSYREAIATPILELCVNALLVLAVPLNILIAYQVDRISMISILGNLPIILLFVMMLYKNQSDSISYLQANEQIPSNFFEKIAYRILKLHFLLKIPIFFILCLPILVIFTGLLMIFGQKPDALIRAFTDTYKHGFSQLDYQCQEVNCDGHFLCTVAANGHKKLIRPERYGVRGGEVIICSRQLLIANAFEELLEHTMPKTHRFIRRNYNKVGKFIHRYYGIFKYKYVADLIYIMMKPLEWFFLLVLYTFDKKPENRIAKQYLSKEDRKNLIELTNNSHTIL